MKSHKQQRSLSLLLKLFGFAQVFHKPHYALEDVCKLLHDAGCGPEIQFGLAILQYNLLLHFQKPVP